MIKYRFVNEDDKYSEFLTDAFLLEDNTYPKSFIITDKYEDPEIIAKGINLIVGIGYQEQELISMAILSGLNLEKYDDTQSLETISVEDTTFTISSPTTSVNYLSEVTFTWTAISGATSYSIFVKENGHWNIYPVISTTAVTATIINRFIPTKKVEFMIVAQVEGGYKRSQVSSFTSALPTITAVPADKASSVTSPVQLSWTNIEGVRYFRVFVQNSTEAFGNDGLYKTDKNFLVLPLKAGSYQWQVNAVMYNGEEINYIQTRTFTVQ